jgi:hypothetical protein
MDGTGSSHGRGKKCIVLREKTDRKRPVERLSHRW